MRAIGREREPKGAGGGGDAGSEILLLFAVSPAMLPEAGGFGGAVGGLQRTDNPSHSLVGWGSDPSSLHLPLLQPVPSSLPARPAQQAGIPGRASPGPARGGSGPQPGVCEGFCCFVLFFPISSLLSGPWSLPALGLWLRPVPASGCLIHPCISATTCLRSPASSGLGEQQALSASAPAHHPPSPPPLPSPRLEAGPQHVEELALCYGCPGPRVPHPVPHPSFPSSPLPSD